MFLHKISSRTKTFTTLPLHHYQIKRNWILKIYYETYINDKLNKSNIKYHTCYYFDDKIKFEDFYVSILIDEKSYKNTSYNISYKTLIGDKLYLLCIRFLKKDRFIR